MFCHSANYAHGTFVGICFTRGLNWSELPDLPPIAMKTHSKVIFEWIERQYHFRFRLYHYLRGAKLPQE
jgi:hypothetical protein